jgi:hypothetical protein
MHWTDDRPLTHPGAAKAVAQVVKGLHDKVYVSRRRPLIFVCGGTLDPSAKNLRKDFLDWAKVNIADQARIFLSEDAYPLALPHGANFINLSDFEQVIAGVSDCILLFPESPGSYSELGIFARSDVSNRTLIANDAKHLKNDSFLMLGPLHTIDVTSRFSPSVTFDSDIGLDPTFNDTIWKRILVRVKTHIVRQRLDASPFLRLPVLHRYSLVTWLIAITGVARFGDLLQIIRMVYPQEHGDAHLLKQTLDSLVALKQIEEPSQELYFALGDRDFDLDVPGNSIRLSSQFRIFWQKEFPNLWSYAQ